MKKFVVLAWGLVAWELSGLHTLAQTNGARLSIQSLPNRRVSLSWTNDGSQLVLQQAASLKPPIPWQSSPNSPLLQSNQFSITLDATRRERYFRLAPAAATLTRISSTSPTDREQGVSVNRETIFYFSQPLATNATITTSQLFARLDQRTILARVELSSDRRKVTLFYLEPIPGSTRLTVTLDTTGLKDEFGQDVDADRDGQPGGVKTIQFDTYSTTPVPGTTIMGHVYASERVTDGKGGLTNKPLERVTITVDGAEETLRTTTDAQGAFALTNCPAGRFFVHLDGRTEIDSDWLNGGYYPVVGKAWEAVPGRADNLASGNGEIFLPWIPAGTLQPISTTQDTVITFAPSVLAANPQLEGVQITVPANSLFSDNGTRGGRAGIAPVAPDRLPELLPPGLDHVLDITVQTDGPSNFDRPVPACFPNLPDKTGLKFAPGEKAVLMSYNHDTGKWDVVGSMTTSADGKLVCTDPGVGIRQPGWHGAPPPPFEPLPCEDQCCEGGGGGGAGAGGGGGGPAPGPAVALSALDARRPMGGAESPCDCPPDGPLSFDACLEQAVQDLGKLQQNCDFDFINCEDNCSDCTLAGCSLIPSCVLDCEFNRQACYEDALAVFKIEVQGCLNLSKKGCFPFGTPAAQSLRSASTTRYGLHGPTPKELIETAIQDIVRLVLSAGPNRLTPEIQAQVDAILANTKAAVRGSITGFLQGEIQRNEAELLATGFYQNDRGNAPGYPILYMARVNRPNGTLELRGVTEPFGRYQIFIPRDGQLERVSFYDPKNQTFGLVHPFLVPELPRRLPRFWLHPLEAGAIDTDADGLPDIVEEIYGTDPANSDTDGDGIPDGVEVTNGTNPLDGRPAALGIVASSDTPGVAQDICVANNFAIIADGPAGVAIFDVRNPLNPIRVAQVQTRAPATAVACSGDFVAATQGAQGLAVIDVSNPLNGFKARDIPVGGPARAVAAADGRAYVGTDNGLITIIDLQSGFVLDHIHTASPVHDLAARGSVLFVALESEFRSYQIDGPIRRLSALPLAQPADFFTNRRRLFVGTTYAQVSNFGGYDNFDISNPSVIRLIGVSRRTGPGSFEQIVDTGSGLGVATVGATANSAHDIYLFDLSDPTDTSRFLTILRMPGVARAVTIHNGLALVADGEAGLQVVNFRAFDTQKKAPTISLQTSFPFTRPTSGEVEAGQIVHVLANVSDDVQVRNAEFYLDGTLVATDGNFPFEYRFVAPQATATNTSFTIRARALDTGGNATSTDEITVNLRPDTTPPRILQTVPPAGTILGSVKTVGVIFSEPINGAQLNSATLQVHSFGPDGLVGTADDVVVDIASISYRTDLNEAVITFATELAPGTYAVLALPPLADLHGNAFHPQFSGPFFVIAGPDSDQDGVPDAVELQLGLDPHNPDSDGNGIPDGLEDFDGDGLPNAYEVLIGTDPKKTDTDGNGIKDGDEDSDGDSLTNRQEILFGANPLLADSDGDGWNDEAEVTAGTDPLDPNSMPFAGFVAQPPVRVIAPDAGNSDGLPFNTFVAEPPVKVVAPALGTSGELPFNTFVAEPPVKVVAPALGTPGELPFNTFVAEPPVQVRIQ